MRSASVMWLQPDRKGADRELAVIGGIVMLGLLARLAVRLVLDGPIEIFEYQEIVDNLLNGRGFVFTYHGVPYHTIGSPLFPLFNALVYWVFGPSPVAMLIVESLLSAVAAGACYWIGRQLFSPTAGAVAAALIMLHPAFILYDTHKVHPLSFDAALAASGLALVLALSVHAPVRLVVLTALVHGLGMLERSTFVGFVPLALAALWMTARDRRVALRMGLYAITIAAVFAPWVVRNLQVYGAFVPVSTLSSELLWRGNNPRASGGAFADGAGYVPMFDVAPPDLKAEMVGKDELGQSRVFAEAARRFIRAEPGAAAGLYLKKLSTFWWFSSQSGALYPAQYLNVYQVYYLIMMALAVLGIWTVVSAQDLTQASRLAGMLAFVASVGLLQAVFYVEVRHRWGVEPLLLVLSAGGLWRIMRSLPTFRYAAALSGGVNH